MMVPFVGREDLFADLDRQVSRMRANDPKLWLLSGPPGVGKTAFLNAYSERRALSLQPIYIDIADSASSSTILIRCLNGIAQCLVKFGHSLPRFAVAIHLFQMNPARGVDISSAFSRDSEIGKSIASDFLDALKKITELDPAQWAEALSGETWRSLLAEAIRQIIRFNHTDPVYVYLRSEEFKQDFLTLKKTESDTKERYLSEYFGLRNLTKEFWLLELLARDISQLNLEQKFILMIDSLEYAFRDSNPELRKEQQSSVRPLIDVATLLPKVHLVLAHNRPIPPHIKDCLRECFPDRMFSQDIWGLSQDEAEEFCRMARIEDTSTVLRQCQEWPMLSPVETLPPGKGSEGYHPLSLLKAIGQVQPHIWREELAFGSKGWNSGEQFIALTPYIPDDLVKVYASELGISEVGLRGHPYIKSLANGDVCLYSPLAKYSAPVDPGERQRIHRRHLEILLDGNAPQHLILFHEARIDATNALGRAVNLFADLKRNRAKQALAEFGLNLHYVTEPTIPLTEAVSLDFKRISYAFMLRMKTSTDEKIDVDATQSVEATIPTIIKEAEVLCQQAGSSLSKALLLSEVGLNFRSRGKIDEGMEKLNSALLQCTADDAPVLFYIRSVLLLMYGEDRKFDEAAKQAAMLDELIGDNRISDQQKAAYQNNWAAALFWAGFQKEDKSLMERAYGVAKGAVDWSKGFKPPDEYFLAQSSNQLALTLIQLGSCEEAANLLQSCVTTFLEHHDYAQAADSMNNLGEALEQIDKVRAIKQFQASINFAIFAELETTGVILEARTGLIRSYLAEGESDLARGQLEAFFGTEKIDLYSKVRVFDSVFTYSSTEPNPSAEFFQLLAWRLSEYSQAELKFKAKSLAEPFKERVAISEPMEPTLENMLKAFATTLNIA